MSVRAKEITYRGEYVEAIVEGTVGAAPPYGYQAFHRAIAEACSRHDCTHVLLDASHVDYATTDIFFEHFLAEDLAKSFPPPVRVAIIAPADVQLQARAQSQSGLEPRQSHLEVMARTRGMTMRLFCNREAALSWLLTC